MVRVVIVVGVEVGYECKEQAMMLCGVSTYLSGELTTLERCALVHDHDPPPQFLRNSNLNENTTAFQRTQQHSIYLG